MKKIYYFISLNMISVALMAQTSTQPTEREETIQPTTDYQYGRDGGKIEITNQELLRNENTLVEKPAQAKSDKPVNSPLAEENSQLMAKESQDEAPKSKRTANGRRPLPIRISIGALMLSAKR